MENQNDDLNDRMKEKEEDPNDVPFYFKAGIILFILLAVGLPVYAGYWASVERDKKREALAKQYDPFLNQKVEFLGKKLTVTQFRDFYTEVQLSYISEDGKFVNSWFRTKVVFSHPEK